MTSVCTAPKSGRSTTGLPGFHKHAFSSLMRGDLGMTEAAMDTSPWAGRRALPFPPALQKLVWLVWFTRVRFHDSGVIGK